MSNILGYNGVPLGINGAPITCASAGPDLPDSSTVTTLANSTWLLNPTIDDTSLPTKANAYKVLFQTSLFNSNYQNYNYGYFLTPVGILYGMHYNTTYVSSQGLGGTYAAWDENNKEWIGYSPNVTISKNGTVNTGCRLITFFGDGASMDVSDNTNATLITWMKNNATLINIGY